MVRVTDRPELWVANVGRLPYAEAVEIQDRIRTARQADAIPDSLLLLEHDPVYTKGRRTAETDLPMGESWYRSQGIEVYVQSGSASADDVYRPDWQSP